MYNDCRFDDHYESLAKKLNQDGQKSGRYLFLPDFDRSLLKYEKFLNASRKFVSKVGGQYRLIMDENKYRSPFSEKNRQVFDPLKFGQDRPDLTSEIGSSVP